MDFPLKSGLEEFYEKVYEELFEMAHRRHVLHNATFNPE
jgi:hypothetical protein